MISHAKLFGDLNCRMVLSPNCISLNNFIKRNLIFKYFEMYHGVVLASFSQTVGSLLRTP
jgi:hypothetical protein